jgi:hypothetical protein
VEEASTVIFSLFSLRRSKIDSYIAPQQLRGSHSTRPSYNTRRHCFDRVLVADLL